MGLEEMLFSKVLKQVEFEFLPWKMMYLICIFIKIKD